MYFNKRTHTCGSLCSADVGKCVTLNGWVGSYRNLGGLIFINIRDRYGATQIVFNPQINVELHQLASQLRNEYVVSVTGKVQLRPVDMINSEISTGEIEVLAEELTILNKADPLPFPIENEIKVFEETRLQYRYLDLRRPKMQQNLVTRHKLYSITRRYFDSIDFVEIETPILMKSTPEGARDYLVPSRIHHGKFYALPQSPQTYKQLLMVAGMDRYFQIVKCFRDEDLRADRQPEFTQIDIEMSFVDEKDVMSVAEGLMKQIFKGILNIDIPIPFPQISYKEAIETYGSDKPDTRFGLKIININNLVKDTGFKVFSEIVKKDGVVGGIAIPGCANYTRSQIDNLTNFVKNLGAGGLVWIKITEQGIESPIEKFVGKEILNLIKDKMDAKIGDLILLVSDSWFKAYTVLGELRLEIARRLKLIDELKWNHVWITDFPMFEYDELENRYIAVHHPFTSPRQDDISLLDNEPMKVRARAYDLVLNGNEIAGGSIRIHKRELQQKVFNLLGIDEAQAKKKFGFLLEAFRFGAPPHGGIAFGYDRICMLLCGEKSIRDVIAFPKTAKAMSLMDDSPSEVDKKQLEELHIKIT